MKTKPLFIYLLLALLSFSSAFGQTPQDLNKPFRLVNPGDLDSWVGPYSSLAAARAAVPVSMRAKNGVPFGRTVKIMTAQGIVEYWWKNGTGDNDLVEKNIGGTGDPSILASKADLNYVDAELAGKANSATVNAALAAKQAALVSGTNIKSINGNSLLGSGDITITGGSADQALFDKKADTSLVNTKAVAHLQAMTAPSASANYFTPDGWLWRWNPTSTASENIGTVVKCQLNTGRFERQFIGPVHSLWFFKASDPGTLQDRSTQLRNLVENYGFRWVTLDEGDYGLIPRNAGGALGGGLNLPSNFHLTINGNIKCLPGYNLTTYQLIKIYRKVNVLIDGTGEVWGDWTKGHVGTTGNYGMNISIISSKNVTIDGNIYSRYAWADGLYVGGEIVEGTPLNTPWVSKLTGLPITYDHDNNSSTAQIQIPVTPQFTTFDSENINIRNFTADSCGRNGISIIGIIGGSISNSKTNNSGRSAPMAGIDIEPNNATFTYAGTTYDVSGEGNKVERFVVNNHFAEYCKGSGFSTSGNGIIINGLTVKYCGDKGAYFSISPYGGEPVIANGIYIYGCRSEGIRIIGGKVNIKGGYIGKCGFKNSVRIDPEVDTAAIFPGLSITGGAGASDATKINTTIEGLTIENSADHGAMTTSALGFRFINCYFIGSGGYGLRSQSGPSSTYAYGSAIGCLASKNAQHGFGVGRGVHISDSWAVENGFSGFIFSTSYGSIKDCHSINNAKSSSSRYGVEFVSGASYCLLENTEIKTGSDLGTQHLYAIRLGSSTNLNNRILNNDTETGGTAGEISDLGTGTLYSLDRIASGTGTALTFVQTVIRGTPTVPVTGNITADVTNARFGTESLMIHNTAANGVAPTFDSKFKKSSISGSYVLGQINYIWCKYISATEIIYRIEQRN